MARLGQLRLCRCAVPVGKDAVRVLGQFHAEILADARARLAGVGK